LANEDVKYQNFLRKYLEVYAVALLSKISPHLLEPLESNIWICPDTKVNGLI
jgi:hypothetical protein